MRNKIMSLVSHQTWTKCSTAANRCRYTCQNGLQTSLNRTD